VPHPRPKPPRYPCLRLLLTQSPPVKNNRPQGTSSLSSHSWESPSDRLTIAANASFGCPVARAPQRLEKHPQRAHGAHATARFMLNEAVHID
jgi:hypothetical protein